MRDSSKEIERLRERAQQSDSITSEDGEMLIELSDRIRLLRSQYGDLRHEKLLRECVRIAEQVGRLAEALDDRSAAEEIVRWFNREYDNEETNRDYRTALRVFGKLVTQSDEPPESLAWIPSGYSRNYDPRPNPGDMLRWEEDVLSLIDATQNHRDAALIAVAWDAGARSNELEILSVGDVTDSQYGLQITVVGKTGQRTVTLMPSVPYLQKWLADHPARKDNSAPLWSKLQSPEGLSYQMLLKIFKSAAERAGIDKPVTPTNFRKSSASHLASKGMNQASIEDHHGWTRGSDVASRYVSVFSEDTDRELARIYGKDIEEEETNAIAPLDCPRCDRETPREQDFCVWCGQALKRGAAEDIQEKERRVRQSVLRLASKDPKLLSEQQRAENLVRLTEEHPGLISVKTSWRSVSDAVGDITSPPATDRSRLLLPPHHGDFLPGARLQERGFELSHPLRSEGRN